MPTQRQSRRAECDGSPERRAAWLGRSVAAFAAVLFAATWRLWTPQTDFPQVPLIGWAAGLPAWCDWMVASCAMAALLGVLASRYETRFHRAAWLVFACAVAMSIVLDQHRLQPWAYQFAVLGIVLAAFDARRAVAVARLLTVSIYFYSAVSKFDYLFLHGLGQQFAASLAGIAGLSLDGWPEGCRLSMAAAFPIGELLVAGALVVRRTRTLGVAAAIAMHVMLMIIVGPWGLGHKPGVLIWNLFFVVQNVVLFAGMKGPPRAQREGDVAMGKMPHETAQGAAPSSRVGRWMAEAVVAAVLLLPLLEPWGWFDHWPAWGLYAPRSSRVAVYIHRGATSRLPADVARHLAPTGGGEEWVPLEIDRWSLAALDVPLYPQSRFQWGVAEAVGRRYGLDYAIRAVGFSPASRWTGLRGYETVSGVHQIASSGDRHRFNAHPRNPWRGSGS